MVVRKVQKYPVLFKEMPADRITLSQGSLHGMTELLVMT